jgi:glyoxylase-like metal-dependent hydrolase (beta-lactamase superfamily II)
VGTKRVRWLLPLVFAALLCLATFRHLNAAGWTPTGGFYSSIATLRAANPPQQGGTLPSQWPAGNDCSTEPRLLVHKYNSDLYILRQSKCQIFEAPFMYLIFGEDKVLLMDTGAKASDRLVLVVRRLVKRWLKQNGKTSIPLVVAHTHSHNDHVASDNNFLAASTAGILTNLETLVGPSISAVTSYWGFQKYPNDVPTIDLGNRVIDVLGTPGHQAASLTLYDRNTQLLLTGDIVYPGHLFVFSPAEYVEFVDSLQRLVDWAAANPVQWVLGCHIEFSNTPFEPYAWGNPVHPDERRLEFAPTKLTDILLAAKSLADNPQCTIFDEFVIHPVYKCGITWNGP